MGPNGYSNWRQQRTQSLEKNDYRFDANTLRMFVNLLLSTENINVRKSDYGKLETLISHLNMDYYIKDEKKMYLIKLIKLGLQVFEKYQYPTKSMMITTLYHVLDNVEEASNFKELNDDEIRFITQYINSCVTQNYFYKRLDDLLELLSSVKMAQPIDRNKYIDKACSIMREIVTDHEMNETEDRDSYFDLEDENFTKTMKSAYETLSQSSHRLKTGMVGFNELLGGGIESGRAYMVIGPSCEGKSGLLLDLAVQLKEYNPKIVTKDPTLKPCIAYLTQENAMSETLERLWNITTAPGEDIVTYNLEDVMGKMRTVGGLVMDEENSTNLAIVYRKPFTNTTFWFYEFIEEMKNRGYEVVCLIHDYIQRIHSASEEARKELRLELGAIMNEECTLAKRLNISFITAGQINRGANDKLTQMRLKQSTDRVSNMGQSDIAESIQIIYNADVVFGMAREKDPMTGMEYLGFNKIKGRDRRKTVSNTVYQPVDPNCAIKLIRDLGKLPVHRYTLAPQIHTNNDQKIQGTFNIQSSTMSSDIVKDGNDQLDGITQIMKNRGLSDDYIENALRRRPPQNQPTPKFVSNDYVAAYRKRRDELMRPPKRRAAYIFAKYGDFLNQPYQFRTRGGPDPHKGLREINSILQQIMPAYRSPNILFDLTPQDNCPFTYVIPPDAV